MSFRSRLSDPWILVCNIPPKLNLLFCSKAYEIFRFSFFGVFLLWCCNVLWVSTALRLRIIGVVGIVGVVRIVVGKSGVVIVFGVGIVVGKFRFVEIVSIVEIGRV